MRSEREKITGKVAAATLRLNANRYELPPDEDTCYLLLVSEGSVTLEYEGGNVLVNPGSAVLLGPGGCRFAQTGSAVPQIVGCHFPQGTLMRIHRRSVAPTSSSPIPALLVSSETM